MTTSRLDERWVVDDPPSERFRIHTRADAGEVLPDPVTPLSWTIAGAEYAEAGWHDALERFGAATHDELDPDNLDVMGVFGDYCYLNVSVMGGTTRIADGAIATVDGTAGTVAVH